MLEWLKQIDYWIFTKINNDGSFALGDLFFPAITDLHKLAYFKVIVLPIVFFLFYKKFSRKGISLFLFLLLSLGFSDFSGKLVKNYYERTRPFENSEIAAIQKSPAAGKSFYSNHTTNMFNFATYTSVFFPQLKIPLFVFAGLIAYSRIYNGVHYPSDVLAGGLMGIFWGFVFSSLIKIILKKLDERQKVLE